MEIKYQTSMETIYKNNDPNQLIRHVVGPVVYLIYCTETGVSVHSEKREDLNDGFWECQMQLVPHGKADSSPAVDISVSRTDR
jgi:hypothetical protein